MDAPLTVLVIEDNPGDAELVRYALGATLEIEVADRLSTAMARLDRGGVSVVLLDLSLPDTTGLQGFERLHTHYPRMPIVVLTGLRDEDLARRAVAAGAQDYLVKGAFDEILPRALRYAVERQEYAERTRLLAEERVARREAEQAVALRDEFLAVASHELRTPLSALILELQSLQARAAPSLDPKSATRLERALRSVNRLGGLIETLLDVSTIRSGRMMLRREPIDLGEAARQVAGRLARTASEAGCEIRVCTCAAPAECDRQRIEQVLTNLIGNAMKYGAGQPVDVVVLNGSGGVRVMVSDHGPGIPEGDLQRIFGAFERAVESRRHGGFGLGLYVSRMIAEAHGGSIVAANRPDGGATFTVTLPSELRGAAPP